MNYTITGHDWGEPLTEFSTTSRSQAIQHLFNILEKSPGAIVTITYGLATIKLDYADDPDIVEEVFKLQPRHAALLQSSRMTPEARRERALKAVRIREEKRKQQEVKEQPRGIESVKSKFLKKL